MSERDKILSEMRSWLKVIDQTPDNEAWFGNFLELNLRFFTDLRNDELDGLTQPLILSEDEWQSRQGKLQEGRREACRDLVLLNSGVSRYTETGRMLYKVNCADCGTYVRESEFPHMATVCSGCAAAAQADRQAMDAPPFGGGGF